MSDIFKLYEKAYASPSSFTFSELCSLLEGAGFVFDRQKGSHKIYKHPSIQNRLEGLVNVQNDHGKANAYQVKAALNLIDKYELLRDGGAQ